MGIVLGLAAISFFLFCVAFYVERIAGALEKIANAPKGEPK